MCSFYWPRSIDFYRFIQDRYKEYLAKINRGKEKKQGFFARMQNDIIEREEQQKDKSLLSLK